MTALCHVSFPQIFPSRKQGKGWYCYHHTLISSSSMAAPDSTPHVAILCSPGMGHLIPLAAFAALLADNHHLSVTLITHSTGHSSAHNSIISSLPSQVTVISIPQALTLTPATTNAEARITSSVHTSLPHLRSTLLSLTSTAPLSALIFDFFLLDALEIAADLRIPSFLLLTTNCFCLSFALHLPTLDGDAPFPDPLALPGCIPLRASDYPDPLHDRNSEGCRQFLRLLNRFPEVNGILVNSFVALEPLTFNALKQNPNRNPNPNLPPVYTIGPIVGGGGGSSAGCLDWLDRQPSGSVVYVSFGSGGTLSSEQMIELAWGLEESDQRFLWVVRAPDDNERNGAFFSSDDVGGADELSGYLPEGFVSRTRGRGLVVASLAPQMKVLGHGATGGFVTHCGWNSTLESIVNGVPMIAWPLYAEQRMNAVMLAEGVKVAMRVEEGEGGLVGRGDVADVVRKMMEGEEGERLRERVGVLSEEARRAVGEGGSSWKAMAEVIGGWRGM